VPGLFDRRLIFVTGKGGVGKSTVAIALGVLGVRRGLRTIVAELASQDRVRRTFDQEGSDFQELELSPGLYTISIDPQQAMSKLFQAFAMATPGMRELLSVGKVWELAQLERRTRGAAPYDLVVVDAPATGHGVGILRTPKTFAEIARVGPIASQGNTIAATIADREFTSIVAVATAEEMPVNETFSLRDALARDDLPLDAVIVNALYPARFDAEQIPQLEAALGRAGSPLAGHAIRAALSEHARGAAQQEQLTRLGEGLHAPLVELPYLFADPLGEPELERLADALEAGFE
jgi:anion-transporting  ArsA/GET3 family ATPase